MTLQIKKLPVPSTMLGESPHWDSQRQTLYYVSLIDKTLNRYVPATKEHAKTKIDTEFMCTFIIPVVNSTDLFIVNLGRKLHVLCWDGLMDSPVVSKQVLAELEVENPSNMVNDGKVDPRGRLFTGTIGIPSDRETSKNKDGVQCVPSGSMYSITADGEVTTHDTGVTVSNGLAFDLKRKALYHIDTFAECIRRFDYDVDSGETSNKSILFNFKESNALGKPDGMTIDTDGNLWVACYDGSSVLKINPDTGKVIQTLEMPDKTVTSVTFGGKNLDILFVTTRCPKGYEERNTGGTYAVTGLGVRGYENLPFECILHANGSFYKKK